MCEAGETFSSAATDTAIIPFRASIRAIEYCEIDGRARVEGCIDLGNVATVRKTTQECRDLGPALSQAMRAKLPAAGHILETFGSAIGGSNFRWKKARVPVEIDGLPPAQQTEIGRALAHWTDRTSITFPDHASTDENWVRFSPGGGCASEIGCRGGMQQIWLSPACGFGNIVHEIGHTIGLWHEQSRLDRDLFLKVLWQNIDPAMKFNFDQRLGEGSDIGEYDYDSIMHYGPKAFSMNGLPTLEPLGPFKIGQRLGLSSYDIESVARLYPEA